MTRIGVALALLACAAGCIGTGEHERLAARVHAVVEPLVEAGEFNGAVALLREGRIIYQRGFGRAAHAGGAAFTPDTPAEAGSLTHTLIAAGIWLLAYDGRLDPDAPVARYLREYPHPVTTVRQLINHTTDLGFDVATRVIERVSGMPFEDFLEHRFFSRFGMTNAFLRDSKLFLSAADLGRWADANAAGRAMAPGAFQAGQQHALIEGRPSPITGLGWRCDESALRCYHASRGVAFYTFAYWDRERHEAVALIAASGIPQWKVVPLQRGLVDALAGDPVAAEPPHDFLKLDAASRASLAGSWSSEDLGDLTITAADASLRLRIGSGLEFEVLQVDAETFYVPALDYWIAFAGQEGASVMHLRSMFVDTVARRVDRRTLARVAHGNGVNGRAVASRRRQAQDAI